MPTADSTPDFFWNVTKRQLAVVAVGALLVSAFVTVFYLRDREKEWRLRQEQAEHRLDLAREIVSKELESVRSDALFLAQLDLVQDFFGGNTDLRATLEKEFCRFLAHKKKYDQVRLLDMSGKEVVRVDSTVNGIQVTPQSELQDKKERYYFQQSRNLQNEQVFVSDFDLNQEHGEIEQPLKPVIRFVTPVVGQGPTHGGLLVINYLGSAALDELRNIAQPGFTLLIRPDGQFLLGTQASHAWGWLLGHQRSFANDFPEAWVDFSRKRGECILTSRGAFASRTISLSDSVDSPSISEEAEQSPDQRQLTVVSYLPRAEVFVVSNQMLRRFLLIGAVMLIPLLVLARFWAVATARRRQQNVRILRSEEKLRDLSSRLLRVQEEERRAISREIHDELGQQVTAINLDLKLAQREQQSETARQQLNRAVQENEQLLSTLHDFARRVRPAVLDDLGLFDAVESHIWEFESRTGIQVDFDMHPKDCQLSPVVAENVFRLLQESLNNVLKHANAKRVTVNMRVDGDQNTRTFYMIVADNGKGVDPQTADSSRLGLIGMQERVDLLGGQLQIAADGEVGTKVEVWIPLESVD